MDKTINQKAWFLVLPVFLVVAFSAILPRRPALWACHSCLL